MNKTMWTDHDEEQLQYLLSKKERNEEEKRKEKEQKDWTDIAIFLEKTAKQIRDGQFFRVECEFQTTEWGAATTTEATLRVDESDFEKKNK